MTLFEAEIGETPEELFIAAVDQWQAWCWERFCDGTAEEFQAKLDADKAALLERFRAAQRRAAA